jgi:hypothetical protein
VTTIARRLGRPLLLGTLAASVFAAECLKLPSASSLAARHRLVSDERFSCT